MPYESNQMPLERNRLCRLFIRDAENYELMKKKTATLFDTKGKRVAKVTLQEQASDQEE